MQLYKSAVSQSSKLDIKALAQLLSVGLAECKTDFEKREFGIAAMSLYDYTLDMKYLNYENEKGKYFRNLIYRDESIMLKNIIWNPQAISPIHGHNSNGCWVMVTSGQINEQGMIFLNNFYLVFSRVGGKPKMIEEKVLRPGQITYNHNAIGFHLMENPDKINGITNETPAVTLHCYHPPYDVTALMKPDGEVYHGPLAYYSKFGEIETDVKTGGV